FQAEDGIRGKLVTGVQTCALPIYLRIPAVTLWVLSTENLNRRSSGEVSGILAALESKLTGLAHDPRVREQGVRVRAVGRLDLLQIGRASCRERVQGLVVGGSASRE